MVILYDGHEEGRRAVVQGPLQQCYNSRGDATSTDVLDNERFWLVIGAKFVLLLRPRVERGHYNESTHGLCFSYDAMYFARLTVLY